MNEVRISEELLEGLKEHADDDISVNDLLNTSVERYLDGFDEFCEDKDNGLKVLNIKVEEDLIDCIKSLGFCEYRLAGRLSRMLNNALDEFVEEAFIARSESYKVFRDKFEGELSLELEKMKKEVKN